MAGIWLTENEVLKYLKECWDVSDKHWTTYEKPKWDTSWQLYENRQDYSDKEDWQAKGFIPKSEGSVDTATGLVEKGITGVSNWYGHEGVDAKDQELAPIVSDVVRWWGDTIKITNTIVSAIRTAFICSIGIIKIYDEEYAKWEGSRNMGAEGLITGYEWEPVEAWKPCVDEVDPYDMRFSRDMELYEGKPRGSYIIERKAEELTDLRLKAKRMKYKNVNKVRSEDYPKDAEKQKQQRDAVEEPVSDVMHPVEIKEFQMLNTKIQDAFNGQINAEIYSSYLYLSMSAYFESQNLAGMAAWMRVQAQEELTHAMKFFGFVNEREGRVLLTQVDGPETEWKSPLDVFENALAHEKKVTGLINNLVDLSLAEKDHASNIFLQWFVTEQVEEEASTSKVVQDLERIGDHSHGLMMLDRELGKRTAGAEEE